MREICTIVRDSNRGAVVVAQDSHQLLTEFKTRPIRRLAVPCHAVHRHGVTDEEILLLQRDRSAVTRVVGSELVHDRPQHLFVSLVVLHLAHQCNGTRVQVTQLALVDGIDSSEVRHHGRCPDRGRHASTGKSGDLAADRRTAVWAQGLPLHAHPAQYHGAVSRRT